MSRVQSGWAVTASGRHVWMTRHALERFIERVDSGADAQSKLKALLATGKVRATTRHWMRDLPALDGTRYVYSAAFPGVCAIVRGNRVATVLTRELIRTKPQTRPERHDRAPRQTGRRHDRRRRRG